MQVIVARTVAALVLGLGPLVIATEVCDACLEHHEVVRALCRDTGQNGSGRVYFSGADGRTCYCDCRFPGFPADAMVRVDSSRTERIQALQAGTVVALGKIGQIAQSDTVALCVIGMDYELAAGRQRLYATADQLLVVRQPQTTALIRADQVAPGTVLVSCDDDDLEVLRVDVYELTGPLFAALIGTDEVSGPLDRAEIMQDHLFCVNGIRVADFAASLWYRPDEPVTRPPAGAAPPAPPAAAEPADESDLAGGCRVLSSGWLRRLPRPQPQPYQFERFHWIREAIARFAAVYPDIDFNLQWGSRYCPDASFERRCVNLTGAVLFDDALGYEGLCLIIAHEVAHLTAPGEANEAACDDWAARVTMRQVFGAEAPRMLSEGTRQWRDGSNDCLRGGGPYLTTECRLAVLGQAAMLGEAPACAEGRFPARRRPAANPSTAVPPLVLRNSAVGTTYKLSDVHLYDGSIPLLLNRASLTALGLTPSSSSRICQYPSGEKVRVHACLPLVDVAIEEMGVEVPDVLARHVATGDGDHANLISRALLRQLRAEQRGGDFAPARAPPLPVLPLAPNGAFDPYAAPADCD